MPVTINGGINIQTLPVLARNGRQMQDYYVARLREIEGASVERRGRIQSAGGVRRYQEFVREKVAECFASPFQRVPLDAYVTGTLVRTGYRVEKVIFSSLTGWLVSANFYVPDSATAQNPVPGVVGLCGHADAGKASLSYQTFAQGLAKLGMACLVVDAIGMGDRKQLSVPGTEHRHVGTQAELVGWSMAGMQVWDASVAIDYLLTRPEVDPTKIGTTGNSGGGTQAALLTAFDDRLHMSAPSCWVTPFRYNLEHEMWADQEQLPPNVLKYGLDLQDLLLAHAPKPLILLGQQADYFDVRGLRQVFHDLRRMYELLGAGDNVRLYVGPSGHGYKLPAREQMYQFFSFATGGPDVPVSEPTIVTEDYNDTYCTATHSVNDEPGAIMARDITRDLADAQITARGPISGEALRLAVRDTLGIPSDDERCCTPHYRVLPAYHNWTNNGTTLTPAITPPNYPLGSCCVYAVETDPGILASLYFVAAGETVCAMEPVPDGTRAILFVPHLSADQELAQKKRDPTLNSVMSAEPGVQIFALDTRGTGESKSNCNADYPDDFYALHANMIGEPILGRIVWDILRSVDLMAAHGYTDIHLVAAGFGAIPAALAALFDDNITQVTLRNSLTRWRACAASEPQRQAWPASRMPFDVLRRFDLPDVYAELASKNLVQLSPWGASFAQQDGEF